MKYLMFIGIVLILTLIAYIIKHKNYTLWLDIERIAYKAMAGAEILEPAILGEDKLNFVLGVAYEALPSGIKKRYTEDECKQQLQFWYNKMKADIAEELKAADYKKQIT